MKHTKFVIKVCAHGKDVVRPCVSLTPKSRKSKTKMMSREKQWGHIIVMEHLRPNVNKYTRRRYKNTIKSFVVSFVRFSLLC